MKNRKLSQLLRSRNKNSGFTLLELLTGLIMSTIVISALGFGLMQILRTTKSETSKIKVRSETSRALDFVSDEIKRARTIEDDAGNANATNLPIGGTIVFALDIPEISDNVDVDGDGNLLGSDDDTATSERVVYYLRSATGNVWEGPQVLYRWGPPLDDSGEYTEGNWDEEALIDKIDDTAIASNPCNVGSQTLTPPLGTAAGFYACIEDDNLDGEGISAQLYFVGEVDAASGYGTDTYEANTQVAARARETPANLEDNKQLYSLSFETLKPSYACTDGSDWAMRTDFTSHANSDPNDSILDNSTSWVRDPGEADRQPQPLQITERYLTISSSPVGRTGCNRGTGNEYRKTKNVDGTYSLITDGNGDPIEVPTTGDDSQELLSNYEVQVQVELDLEDWATTDTSGDLPYYPQVKNDPNNYNPVVILENEDDLSSLPGGYDANDNGIVDPGDQKSLKQFLSEKGYYDLTNNEVINLDPDERIIAIEVGQAQYSPTDNPGFDLQDNIFILKSDAFNNN